MTRARPVRPAIKSQTRPTRSVAENPLEIQVSEPCTGAEELRILAV